MTIVLQNRFWDLTVDEERFSVGLSFNQIPSKLVIPYAAITGFHDPAVNFELRFQAQEADEEEIVGEDENDGPVAEPIEDGSNVVAVDFKRKKEAGRALRPVPVLVCTELVDATFFTLERLSQTGHAPGRGEVGAVM